MNIKLSFKRRNRQRGQGLVEFALAFPIFLLIVLGIFEFGRAFITFTSLYAAAREGARFGAAVDSLPSCGGGIESNADRIGFLAGDLNVTHVYDHGPGTATFACTSGGGNLGLGDRVLVTASIDFKSITGIIPAFTMSSTAQRTIIREVRLSYTLAPPGAATAIPQATDTPGPAPTATPNGTPPDDTPTVTPTTAGTCNGTMTWTAGANKSSTATFTNNNGSSYILTGIKVFWQNTDPTLNEVIYIGSGYAPLTGLLTISGETIVVPNWVVASGPSLFEFIFSSSTAKFLGIQMVMTDPVTNTTCNVY